MLLQHLHFSGYDKSKCLLWKGLLVVNHGIIYLQMVCKNSNMKVQVCLYLNLKSIYCISHISDKTQIFSRNNYKNGPLKERVNRSLCTDLAAVHGDLSLMQTVKEEIIMGKYILLIWLLGPCTCKCWLKWKKEWSVSCYWMQERNAGKTRLVESVSSWESMRN